MSNSNHVLVFPAPYQGHVIPAMALSHHLVDHGFTVTFVNTTLSHERITNSMSKKYEGDEMKGIQMVCVSDGLAPDESMNNIAEIMKSLIATVPANLEQFIRDENEKKEHPIEWLIVDENMAFTIPVAKKMGLKVAVFWPAAATTLTTLLRIPKLVQDGLIDENGLAVNENETFEAVTGTPPIPTSQFMWNYGPDFKAKKVLFQSMSQNNKPLELAEFVICNSFHELEKSIFNLFSQILPIGPLIADQGMNKPIGHFWKEDDTCLKWLDKQPDNSVIYVAFGSLTIFDKCQFEEIALGLELCNRPFLWVVRPGLTSRIDDTVLDEYKCRIESRGMLVEWCPQQQVLGHRAIACFVSHCGWNSTLEGVMNGVPFICWPYLGDQAINKDLICYAWKIGLEMNRDDKEMIISREMIKETIDALLGDEKIRARATKLKEFALKSLMQGGTSWVNFKIIVEIMKGQSCDKLNLSLV